MKGASQGEELRLDDLLGSLAQEKSTGGLKKRAERMNNQKLTLHKPVSDPFPRFLLLSLYFIIYFTV